MSAMNTDTQSDVEEIRQLMAAWSAALEAKDVDALTADYVPDALLFDAVPPYKREGVAAIRMAWSNCLPCFPDRFKSEHRDVTIHVSGDTAFVHCLHHIIAEDHPAGQTWLRVTTGYRRVEGKWKAQHEHVSIPFNPIDNQAWFIRDPDRPDQPDFTPACEGEK